METRDRNWIVLKILEFEKNGLSEEDLELVYDKLECISLTEIHSIITLFEKTKNPNTLRQIKLQIGNYRPSKRTRARCHRSQRKRGYTDKGTLPDHDLARVRKIQKEDCIHIQVLEEYFPELLHFIDRYGKDRLYTREGDYVILSTLQLFVLQLTEEGLLTRRFREEFNELFNEIIERRKLS